MNNRWTFLYSYLWGILVGIFAYELHASILAAVFYTILVGQFAWTINLRNASRMIAKVLADRRVG